MIEAEVIEEIIGNPKEASEKIKEKLNEIKKEENVYHDKHSQNKIEDIDNKIKKLQKEMIMEIILIFIILGLMIVNIERQGKRIQREINTIKEKLNLPIEVEIEEKTIKVEKENLKEKLLKKLKKQLKGRNK